MQACFPKDQDICELLSTWKGIQALYLQEPGWFRLVISSSSGRRLSALEFTPKRSLKDNDLISRMSWKTLPIERCPELEMDPWWSPSRVGDPRLGAVEVVAA